MNRRIFFLLSLVVAFFTLLHPVSGQTATRPKNVAGFTFGSTYEEVWQILTERPGVALPPAMPPPADRLDIPGGDFGGKVVINWGFEFNDGKLSALSILFKPEPTALALYRELKQQLAGKYGSPTGERKPDLSEGDRRARLRGAGGRDTVGIVSYWKFPPTIADRNARSIVCEAVGPGGLDTFEEPLLQIILRYVDETQKAVRPKATPAAPPKPVATPKKDDF